MKKLMIMACAAAVAAMGYGETIEITLTANTDITSALTAAGSSVDELNGGAKKAYDLKLYGPATGTYTIAFDVPLGSWTGNLDVGAGVTVSNKLVDANSKYLLGSTTGVAYIRSGASLYIDSSICGDYNGWQIKRPTHIAGTGIADADGGAIRMFMGVSGNQIYNGLPYSVVLDADARITFEKSGGNYVHNTGTLDLNYKNLTFYTPKKYTSLGTYYHVGQLKNCKGSQIIFDRTILYTRNNSYPGDKTTKMIFRNNGYFLFNETSSSKAGSVTKGGPWTMIYESTAGSSFATSDRNFYGCPELNCWPGPMQFDRTIYTSFGSAWSNTNSLSLAGSISGSGGIEATGHETIYKQQGPYARQLYLAGTNTFTGTLAVTRAALELMSDQAIPEGKQVTLANAAVNLYNGTTGSLYDYYLGEMAISGTTRIDAQDWFLAKANADATTVGANAKLTIEPMTFDAGDLVVAKGATVTFTNAPTDAIARRESAGLWYGYLRYTCTNRVWVTAATTNIITEVANLPVTDRVLKYDRDTKLDTYCNARIEDDKVWGVDSTLPVTNIVVTKFSVNTHPGYMSTPLKNSPYNVLYTNSVVSVPHLFDCAYSKWNSIYCSYDNAYKTYSGYIWNDTDSDQQWDFLFTVNGLAYVTIGDNATYYLENTTVGGSKPKSKIKTFTLKPGANKFTLRFGNQFVSVGNFGNLATNDLENCYNGMSQYGVYINRNGGVLSKDMNDYETITSLDAEKPLFSRCTTVAELKAMTGYDCEISADSISGEGTIDLCGGTLKVGTVDTTNIPKIVNGQIEILNAFTDCTKPLDLSVIPSATLDVTQDATKRRADLTGMWYGLVRAVNSTDYSKVKHATASYFSNALADTKADFYMTYPETEVVTEMTPMTYVTTWPTEGEAYSNLWKSAATDSFWATDPNRYKTWKGYVWNSSSTNEIWTVINCNNAYVDLRLNGGQCYKDNVTDNRGSGKYSGQNGYSRNTYTAQTGKLGGAAKKTQIAVVPGANELKVRYYSRWDACSYWPGATETNVNGAVFTKWSEGHGLVFDRKGRGTTDIDNYEDFKDATGQLLTREMTDAFPYIRGAGKTVDLSGKETATGMLIGDIKASNGSLVVDGVWNLTAAEVEDDVASTRLQFNASSRLVITDATMAEIYAAMSASGANGYELATGVVGNVKPKLVSAVGDKRMSLVLKDGTLTLMPGLGTLIIAK